MIYSLEIIVTPIGDNNGFGRGLYAIPDQQERIDEIVNQSNGSLGALAKDTNGDGVWDTTAVLVGMISANQINQTGVWNDYKEFFAHIDDVIAEDNRPVQYSTQSIEYDTDWFIENS